MRDGNTGKIPPFRDIFLGPVRQLQSDDHIDESDNGACPDVIRCEIDNCRGDNPVVVVVEVDVDGLCPLEEEHDQVDNNRTNKMVAKVGTPKAIAARTGQPTSTTANSTPTPDASNSATPARAVRTGPIQGKYL